MKKTAYAALFLLLCQVWAILGQQSGISIQGGEAGQAPKKGEQFVQPLTNEAIIRFVKAGLDEDTVISMVNTQPGKYSFGGDDITALKTAGVSGKIITAKVNKSASTPTPAPVAPTGVSEKQDQSGPPVQKPERMPPKRQDTSSIQLPETPGLYCITVGEVNAVIGQAVLFRRTGGLLAGALTFGIVSGKINIKIPGTHAGTHLGSRPVFYYHSGPGDPPGVLSLVLARLKESNGNRQLEAKASGAWRASEGISTNSQIQTNTSLASPSVYKVEPQEELKAGEYAFYLRTAGASTQDAFLYAFSVE